jgi:hypothetical protein
MNTVSLLVSQRCIQAPLVQAVKHRVMELGRARRSEMVRRVLASEDAAVLARVLRSGLARASSEVVSFHDRGMDVSVVGIVAEVDVRRRTPGLGEIHDCM